MPKAAAGILLYRLRQGELEVLLAHPGGPFWARKDAGAWTIPKGELDPDEDPLAAARREFGEETGWDPAGEFVALRPRKQPGGKVISAWAVEGDYDPRTLRSNTFAMEWPPRSGSTAEFPEIDRADWFTIPQALEKILPGQREFLNELNGIVSQGSRRIQVDP